MLAMLTEAPPPASLLDRCSLFLDLDGTLLDIQDRPDQVVADEEVRRLLGRLAEGLEGRLAVISGRSIAQIDAMLGPVARRIAVSGSHGVEYRLEGFQVQPVRPAILDEIARRFGAFAGAHEGLLVEEKSFGVALHFRRAPDQAQGAHDLALQLAAPHGLLLQKGKMMVELRVAGGDKGKALSGFMTQSPMSGARPLFIGDDATDEAGFEAAQTLGGAAIMVGDHRPTRADYFLASPRSLREWLAQRAS